MPKSPPPRDQDDARAFEEAMRGARRLEGGARRVTGVGGAGSRSASGKAAVGSAPRGSGGAPFEIEAVGEAVAGRAADVSAEVLRALRRGDHRPEGRLDLHGRTREEALRAVERFVVRSRAEGRRAVLVIHGRGQNSEAGEPVLRPALQEWLAGPAAARAGVMAFAPAPPRAGGTGATVVLLRR
ncbi:MAG TPA: Smr/MutS family protein [Polyangia bacterium]|nr:Smr/MutS family protein [Polyangia bacterium]